MTRGRYQVTRLAEDGAPPRLGPCPCSRPVCLLLVLLLVLLVLAAVIATVLVLHQQAQHRNTIYTADGASEYQHLIKLERFQGDIEHRWAGTIE